MNHTTTLGANLEKTGLTLLDQSKDRVAPADIVYTENPIGAYRGLVFAIAFNGLLALTAAAAYGLWRLLR